MCHHLLREVLLAVHVSITPHGKEVADVMVPGLSS
jgi:hypothetical protein